MRTPLLPAGLVLFSLPAIAAEPPLDATGSLVQMLLALAVIIGLLLGSLHLLKRFGVGKAGAGGLLKVRAATAIGPRERVVLVEVAGKILVLGVAPGRVTALHTLDASELPSAGTSASATAGQSGEKDFQSWLKRTLERNAK